MLDLGDIAPKFTLPGSGETTIDTNALDGALVVYFYPKDDTPGCTTEAVQFTELKSKFDALGITIIGVSPDTAAKHDKFTAKHDLGIALAADEDHTVSEMFGVWVEKSMYGRTYMGIERSTFLIGADGKILRIWRKVKVKGHVEAVLEAAKESLA